MNLREQSNENTKYNPVRTQKSQLNTVKSRKTGTDLYEN